MSGKIVYKIKTLKSILKSLVWGAIIFTLILIILSHFGINIIPILTGAGIIGVAVSLGAQSLIKDFIAGFFIILEGQFHIGDRVKIGDQEGIVSDIWLRVTILKDQKGNTIFIPNSQIETMIRYK